MSTGAQYTAITSKRILGTQDFSTRFLEYLRERTREDFERTWGQDGVYDAGLTIAADGNDQFQINGTAQATDGDGRLLDVNNLTEIGNLFFENANTIVYYVGLQHAVRPVDVAVNPRTGLPDYTHFQDYIGRSADPDSVVDNGPNLTMVVDSVTEVGVSNAGRQVLVYKKVPAEGGVSAAIAIETATVTFSAGSNRITTSALFGQTTPSTTAADYTVVLLGPRVSRNTDLRTESGVCFIGTVTGVGVGLPPTTFDVTDQQPLVGSLSQLHEITRIEGSNGRLKVDVKALSTEVGIDQIRVTKLGTGTVFSVDEDGNVTIEGDLNVTGTTTQEDVVQVNSSETITDNLTAGDDQFTDSHLIKGTWRHTNNAEGTNYFYVNGSTGRVGIGGVDDGSHDLTVTGDFSVTADADVLNLNVAGVVQTDLIPDILTQDLGSVVSYWGRLFSNSVYVGTLGDRGGGGGSITLDADLIPTSSDDIYDIGTGAAMLQTIYTHDLVLDATPGRGVGSDIVPQADSTYDIGSASRRWANLFVNNLSFAGDFLPAVDDSQDIGSPTFRWAEGHFSQGMVVGYSGAITNDTIKLGDANFIFDYNSGDPVIRFDVNDFIRYTRAGNQLDTSLDGTGRLRLTTSRFDVADGLVVGLPVGNGTLAGAILATTSILDEFGVRGENTHAAAANNGAGLYGIGTRSYGVIAESDTSSPDRAALRVVPQDDFPTGAAGDVLSHTDGGMWYRSDQRWGRMPHQPYAIVLSDSVTNTTSLTVFQQGGGDVRFEMPATTLKVGQIVRVRAHVDVVAYSSGNLTLSLMLERGGAADFTLGSTIFTPPSTLTRWVIETTLVVQVIGVGGFIGFHSAQADGNNANYINTSNEPSLNLTLDSSVYANAQWTVAAAGNQVRLAYFEVEFGS